MNVKELLKTMVEKDASDLFLKTGGPPHMRVDGKVIPLGPGLLTDVDIHRAAKELMTDDQRKQFEKGHEVEFSFDIPNIGRFRTSVYYQRSSIAMVFRHVKRKILTFEELNLPSAVLQKLSLEPRGLVLLCGATGSGKYTTLASMIEYINQNLQKHILTIEDPIEFVFEDKKSIVSQREVGLDADSYHSALRRSMLQSPDVLFIGNIRDQETMYTALTAAETGQLVLSTLHTTNSVGAIERIVSFFPPYQHDEIRLQTSLLLKGVIAQRLIPRKDTPGRIPACEVMLGTPTISALIREGKTHEIAKYIEDGGAIGMETFEQRLVKLCKEDKITVEDAKDNADDQSALSLGLRGIKRIQEQPR